MTEDRLPLAELLAKAGDGDFLRTIAESVMQLLMEADVEGMIGAGRHERTLERATYRIACPGLDPGVTGTARSTRGSARCSFAFPSFGRAATSRRSWSRGSSRRRRLSPSFKRPGSAVSPPGGSTIWSRPAEAIADYAAREQTMTDHDRELAAALGLRGAVRADIPFMISAAADAAWSTDKRLLIAAGVIDALRQANILLPSISTIERAGIAGRARARKKATHALLSGLNADQVAKLDALLIVDSDRGVTPLAWLKAIPAAAKPDHVREILDRLRAVRMIGIPAKTGAAIHPDRYRQFVREGRASPAYLIERYAAPRRRATLVAALIDLEERLSDAAIEMADKLIGGVFARAKNTQARRYTATAKDVSRLMRLFRCTIDAISGAIENDADAIAAIDTAVGWTNLLKVRPEVAAIADTADEDPLIMAVDRYATVRKFAPALLDALDEFKAGRGSTRTIAAIGILREMNSSGKCDVPPDAPMPFKKEWRKPMIGADGKINAASMKPPSWPIFATSGVRAMSGSSDRQLTVVSRAACCQLRLPCRSRRRWNCRRPPMEWLDQRGRDLDWRRDCQAFRVRAGG